MHAGGYMFDDCTCISLPMVVMNGEQRKVNIPSACSRAIQAIMNCNEDHQMAS